MSISLWFDIFLHNKIDEKKTSVALSHFFERKGLSIRDFKESPPLKGKSDSNHHYKFFFDAYFSNKGGENYLSTYFYNNRIHITLGNWMHRSYFLPLVRELISFFGHDLKGMLCGDEFTFDAYYHVLKEKGFDKEATTFDPESSLNLSAKSFFWFVFISKDLLSKVDKKYFQNLNWKYEKFENGALILEYETIFDERERDEKGFVKQGQV